MICQLAAAKFKHPDLFHRGGQMALPNVLIQRFSKWGPRVPKTLPGRLQNQYQFIIHNNTKMLFIFFSLILSGVYSEVFQRLHDMDITTD